MSLFHVGDIVTVTNHRGQYNGTVTDTYRAIGGEAYDVSPNPGVATWNHVGVAPEQMRLVTQPSAGSRATVAAQQAAKTAPKAGA